MSSMSRAWLPWIIPIVLLVCGFLAAARSPLVMLACVSLALVTFFGALSGMMRGFESPLASNLIVAASLALVPLRVVIMLVRGDAVDLRRELILFGFTTVLVLAFLASRALTRRLRRQPHHL